MENKKKEAMKLRGRYFKVSKEDEGGPWGLTHLCTYVKFSKN